MWDRIFLISVVVYFIGVLIMLASHFLAPGWGPVPVAVGAFIAGFGGLACVVSGLVLILTTPMPGSTR